MAPLGPLAWIAIVLLIVMVGLLATKALPEAVTGLLVACAMAVTVAAAASFPTPVATPVNLMVKEPGGYRFGDYWKLGLPLLVLYFVVSLAIVPLVWQF